LIRTFVSAATGCGWNAIPGQKIAVGSYIYMGSAAYECSNHRRKHHRDRNRNHLNDDDRSLHHHGTVTIATTLGSV
jgi:hypothetical protein